MRGGYVYFIREERKGDPSGWTKIGWALDPQKRLSQIQVGNPSPLVLVGKCPGSLIEEQEVHRRLADLRGVSGEWFALGSGGEIIEDWEQRQVPYSVIDVVHALLEHEREEIRSYIDAREARECGARV